VPTELHFLETQTMETEVLIMIL